MAAHPEIKGYFRPYSLSIIPLGLLVLFNWGVAIFAASLAWWQMGLLSLLVGQFLCHSISTFAHEIAHQRIFASNRGNMLALFLLEAGTLAFSQSLDYIAVHGPSHHRYLNDPLRDYEWWDRRQVFHLKSKPVWRLFQAIFHLLPGGKLLTTTLLDRLVPKDTNRHIVHRDSSKFLQYSLIAASLLLCLVSGWLINWKAPLYIIWSSSIMIGVWGITFHGQAIAEHDVNDKGKTFSTYGWINLFLFNTGYHDEHHTFPQIPWIYLPKVRELAPEYFQNSSGQSYFAFWCQWALSGFQPEPYNRYHATAEVPDNLGLI